MDGAGSPLLDRPRRDDGPRRSPPAFADTAPEAHRAMLDLDAALWLEPGLRELVEARTAQVNGCAAALAEHAQAAVLLGESPGRLAALAGWRRSPLFTRREQAALELAEALALLPGRQALEAAHRRAADQLGEQELAQLVFACVAANAWNRLELATGRRECG